MTAARVRWPEPIVGSRTAPLTAAPPREPPFDDEVAPRRLTLLGRDEPPLPFPTAPAADRRLTAVATPPTPLSLGDTGRAVRPGDAAARPAVVLSNTSGRSSVRLLPDPARFARQFVQGVIEVLSGRRSVGQLAPLASAGVHAALIRDRARTDRARTGRAHPDWAHADRARTDRAHADRADADRAHADRAHADGVGDRFGPDGRAPLLHSLRVMEPAAGVAEVCAVIQVGERYRAIAARLEGVDGCWRCVRLQVG